MSPWNAKTLQPARLRRRDRGRGLCHPDAGAFEINFFSHPDLLPEDSWPGCSLRVANVNGLDQATRQTALPACGLPRMDRLENKPWCMREFAVVDEDGNLIRMGQML